jgi:twitching motility two-component system response regulator PilG
MRLEFESNLSPLSFTENQSPEIAFGSTNPSDTLNQGIEAARAGNRRRARALLLRVTETEPHNEDAWLWLASVSEYPEELMIFLNNILDVNPENERALEWMKTTKSLLAKTFVERGIDAARSNKTDFARQCFYQAAAHDAKNEMAWLWLASIANTAEEKQTNLTRVLAINPENADAQIALKTERERVRQALLRRASAQALSGERAMAFATLTEILNASPEFEDALVLKAHLTDDFAGKIKCYENVLEVNPSNEAARAGLDSLNALKNFAVSDEPAEDSPRLVRENVSSETNEFAAANDYANALTDDEATEEEFKFEETVEFEEAEETFFASFDESGDAESAELENAVLFAETSFQEMTASDENVNFVPVSFDSPEEDEQIKRIKNIKQVEQTEAEPSDNIFQFDAAPTENISDFGDEIFDDFTADNDFSATNGNQTGDFALTELDEEDVFAPDEKFSESDFALPSVDFPTTSEVSADESAQTKNDYSNQELSASPQSALDEETYEVETNESYSETTGTPETTADVFQETEESAVKVSENSFACPFCNAKNDLQSYACGTCRAVLSLSEMEMLLANENAEREVLERAVARMEEEKDAGDYGEYELMSLGIGHVNLKNFRRGLTFLQQASKTNPNNFVLSSQVNAFALRLEEIERREENTDAPAQPRTILVVDDSATVRKLISGKLEKSGHEVVCAVDGMDALAKLDETSPDLILLDITMPRMDGYQVCKMIRSNPLTKNIPVVMISGKDGFFDKVRGRMAGTTGYITKPFGPETLMKALDVYIKNTHEQIVSAEV